MRLLELVDTSRQVAETSGRLAKIGLLADLLRHADPSEIETVIAFLSGTIRQPKVGVGYSVMQRTKPEHSADTATLTLADVDATFTRLERASGKGSTKNKEAELRVLFGASTDAEQEYLVRLLIGEVRQGALEGLMIEAVARASGLDANAVRRATMLAGDLGAVAHAALTEGARGLERFALLLFRPVQPMLAQTADDVAEALSRLGRAAL